MRKDKTDATWKAVLGGFSTALALLWSLPSAAQDCPDLSPFFAGQESRGQLEWLQVASELDVYLGRCLESGEYFALIGAAWLNAGLLPEALEALERALLLEPGNGAAQIDYAEALFRQGQLFPAIELNQQILARPDVPANLRPALERRDEDWRAATRDTSFRGDVSLGFDSNLNGAPDPGQITLTIAGENVLLALGEEFEAMRGPYTNLGLAARHRRLAPGHQHGFSAEVQGRVSDDRSTDLLQFDGRYNFVRPRRAHSWQIDSGFRSLAFGGSALFTAADFQARYSISPVFTCRPFFDVAAQYQFFHDQNWLNAFDTRLGGGFACPLNKGNTSYGSLSLETALLDSQAIKSDRPGGDRGGWQVAANWQYPLPRGLFRTVVNHTRLEDRTGYSPLLDGGTPRWVNRSYLLLQYRRRTTLNGAPTDLLVNLYHQRQVSNIGLFDTSETTFEVGVSFPF